MKNALMLPFWFVASILVIAALTVGIALDAYRINRRTRKRLGKIAVTMRVQLRRLKA